MDKVGQEGDGTIRMALTTAYVATHLNDFDLLTNKLAAIELKFTYGNEILVLRYFPPTMNVVVRSYIS